MADLLISGVAQTRQYLTGLAAAVRTLQATTVQVGTPLVYGRYVERGTRPHVIRPRNAAALRFQVGGRTVFARSVRHPGTRPLPFLVPAYAAQRGTVSRLMGAGVLRAAQSGNVQDAVNGAVAAGFAVQAEAQTRVPVRTGTLRRSIGTYLNGRKVGAEAGGTP